MSKTITIERRNNYGTQAVYVTSEHREAVTRLTGKKTIDLGDINALRSLGFVVVEWQTLQSV